MGIIFCLKGKQKGTEEQGYIGYSQRLESGNDVKS